MNLFTLVGNTMDLLICMRLLFVKMHGQSSSVFVFVLFCFFHCQIQWICLIAAEWGLWNNSRVKNLPVRPLAPRRKTPGQLYPAFNDLPGWVRNILWGKILAVTLTVSINNYDFINTKQGIYCKLTLMVPGFDVVIPASSLLAFELQHWATDELWNMQWCQIGCSSVPKEQ